MTFNADVAGAISIPLTNGAIPPLIGPLVETVLPIGTYKVQTDGVVLMALTTGGINEEVSPIIFPEMAEFVFTLDTAQNITLAMANVGTCRVTFYPEFTAKRNVEMIRSDFC